MTDIDLKPEYRTVKYGIDRSQRPFLIATVLSIFLLSVFLMSGGLDRESRSYINGDIAYSDLYEKYKISPISKSAFRLVDLSEQFNNLQKEPCDRNAIYRASRILAGNSYKREAVNLLIGFSDICPDSVGDVIAAGNILYEIGDFKEALKVADKSVHMDPSANLGLYLRARTLRQLGSHQEALKAYVDLIRTYEDQSGLRLDVFTDMARSYAALGNYCEAASTIQTYIAFDHESRASNTLDLEIQNYETMGACGSDSDNGIVEHLRLGNGAIYARIMINGVVGNFLVDTGASFVSITPEFASKANIKSIRNAGLLMQTANGVSKADIAAIETIKLGKLTAKYVPSVIMEKGLGKGVDGLLGLSFLSKFDITTRGKVMTISSKNEDNSTGYFSTAAKNSHPQAANHLTKKHHRRH